MILGDQNGRNVDRTLFIVNNKKLETVEALLDYIFECGNFGHKDAMNNTMVMVMPGRS